MKTSDQIAEEWSQQCGDSHYEPGSELAKVIRDAREEMRAECIDIALNTRFSTRIITAFEMRQHIAATIKAIENK